MGLGQRRSRRSRTLISSTFIRQQLIIWEKIYGSVNAST
jgi:hypothetical protein